MVAALALVVVESHTLKHTEINAHTINSIPDDNKLHGDGRRARSRLPNIHIMHIR